MTHPRHSGTTQQPPNLTTTYSLSLLSEYTYTLDTLPLDLSRSFGDLRELDAVLSGSMATIVAKIQALTQLIEQGNSAKEERLWLLTDIAEEANRLKFGGEDKIRVACQAADALKAHTNHLRALAEHLPDFDASTLNRRTTYPHIAAKSFMPSNSLESGRRRRNGFGSLLLSAPDPSPAKRKRDRAARDDDVDGVPQRSPRKERTTEGSSRQRNGRARRPERATSPSESVVSVTSYIPVNHPLNNVNNGRSGGASSNSRNGNNGTSTSKQRSRPSNNRGPTPQIHDHYIAANEHANLNHHHENPRTNGSRRDQYDHPPSSAHPSLPPPYPPPTLAPNAGTMRVHTPYDAHRLPGSLSNTPDWNPPPAQQLEGPGMPVARSSSVHPILSSLPLSTGAITDGAATEGDNGEGDGDDKTYCVCDGVSYGEMIACDDSQCEKEWFHLACIGLAVPPEGRWFCDTCRTRRNAKRSGRGGGKRRTATNKANPKTN